MFRRASGKPRWPVRHRRTLQIALILSLAPTANLAAELDYTVERALIASDDLTQFGLLYRPPVSKQPSPAVVVLHGWAPYGSTGAALVAAFAARFQQAGFVSLALSLRGWPETGGEDDCGLKQPSDVVKAVHWLASRPDVDARRVVLIGYSQGGQVALLANALAAPVRAVVALAAPSDLAAWQKTTSVPGIVDYVRDVCGRGAGLKPRSPLHAVNRMKAPVLLLHGEHDTRVPASHSWRLSAALKDAGVNVELIVIPRAGHALEDVGDVPSILDYLRRHLDGANP